MSRRTPVPPVLPAVALAAALVGCASGDRVTQTRSLTPSPAPSASATASTTASTAPTASAPSPSDDVKTATVSVSGGKVTRESSTFALRRGDRARIVVTSDEADEVHLHTYDVKAPVGPGRPAAVEFTATIPGQFEVELEDAGLLLLVVSVR